jgi:hypothetical protein
MRATVPFVSQSPHGCPFAATPSASVVVGTAYRDRARLVQRAVDISRSHSIPVSMSPLSNTAGGNPRSVASSAI